MVSGIQMIVASSTWAEDLAALESEGDREWLEANDFVPVLTKTIAYESA